MEAISQSLVMVLVFSASSNHSRHVRREVDRAVNRDIPILPFRIEDVPLSPSLEYLIGDVQWLDALTPPLEQYLQHLAETVKLLLPSAGKPESAGLELEVPKPTPTVEAPPDKVPYITAPERRPVTPPFRGPGLAKADLPVRAAAFGLDWLFAAAAALLLFVFVTIIEAAISGPIPEGELRPIDVPALLALFLTVPCYQWVSNSLGTSLGRRVFRLAVVRNVPRENRALSAQEAKLLRPGWWLGFVRTVVSLVGLFLLGLGYLWALRNKEAQTWHDFAAGTVVVQVE